ncbi:SAF domain-containing protein [Murinocardiopsis flavida]|uniref:SAF domain-containing protein n=1 Tax=Murinocardiopsis flavida TaxID=645275 RepID=UPI001474D6FF|nr:SAF domain-containing protein [Murinocardiopsis flavida]
MRLAAPSRRRWRWLAAGALLIACGGAAGAWASLHGEQRVPVATAVSDLPAGHVLTAEDVRVVPMAGAESLDLVDARDGAVGKPLAVPLRANTPIAEAALGGAAFPGEGEAVVAAEVAPGVLPGAAVEGASVAAIITDTPTEAASPSAPPDEEGAEGEQGTAPPPGRSIEARVHAIDAAEAGQGRAPVVVEVVVAAEDAEALARAAGAEQLRFAVVPSGGGR